MTKGDVQLSSISPSKNIHVVPAQIKNPIPLKKDATLSKLRRIPMKGVLSLIGGFIAHLTYGTFFSFGNMTTYITSYMRWIGFPEITYSDLVIIPSIIFVGMGIFMPISGVMGRRIGQKRTMLIGSLIMSASVFLSYFTITHSLWLFTLTYGLMFGFGIGCAYVPPLTICMKWFPGRKGLVSGIVVGGFGAGTFIFSQVQTAYLNPENVRVDNMTRYLLDPVVLSRVPDVFLLLGGSYVALQVIGFLLLCEQVSTAKKPIDKEASKDELQSKDMLLASCAEKQAQSKEEGKVPNGVPQESHEKTTVAGDGLENRDTLLENASSRDVEKQDSKVQLEKHSGKSLRPREALQRKEFYILWFSFCIIQMIVGFMNGMYKAYGHGFIDDDHFLTMVGAIAAIFNASGRSIWGALMDKTSYRTSMSVMTAILATLLFTVTQTPVGGKVMYACWVWAIFLSFSGTYALMPAATNQVFGPTYYGTNYGLIFTNSVIGGPLAALLTGTLKHKLGYTGMFSVLGSGTIIILVLTWFYPRQPSPETTRKITCWNVCSRCR